MTTDSHEIHDHHKKYAKVVPKTIYMGLSIKKVDKE
jgi:hypothetical protein